jgi:hypothetical protein
VKVSPLVVLLVGALVGAVAWGTCNAGRASDANKQLRAALADSTHRWTMRRDSLTDRLRALRTDSATLATSLRSTQASRDAATAEARHLAQRLRESGDTAGARVLVTADSLAHAERLGCALVIQNCEARAENAEERAAGDSILLAQTAILLRQTEAAWRSEQRKNAPGFLGLRSFWKARAFTIPLAAVTTLLLLRR